jgi:hypothetical protein
LSEKWRCPENEHVQVSGKPTSRQLKALSLVISQKTISRTLPAYKNRSRCEPTHETESLFGFGKTVSEAGKGQRPEHVDFHNFQSLTECFDFGKRLAMMERL